MLPVLTMNQPSKLVELTCPVTSPKSFGGAAEAVRG
jgi:hypothetical protein